MGMDENSDLIVKPVEEYDVDVRETLEQELEYRGIDANISRYEQPMLVARTRRKVGEGEYQSFKIEMKDGLLCTQEELDKMIEEKINELFEMG